MNDSRDIDFELTQLAELIELAHKRLKAGNPVDVSALPARTDAVCRRIAQLPRDDGIKLEPRMLAIIENLDKLAADIGDQKQSLSRLLTELEGTQPTDPANGSGA